MKRTPFVIAATLASFGAQAQELTLPGLPGGSLDQLQQSQNDLRAVIGTDLPELRMDQIANISGLIVTYDSSAEAPTLDSATSFAAASQLGLAIESIRPNTFELQVSPFATVIDPNGNPLGSPNNEVIRQVIEALEADETVQSWYPNYNVNHQQSNGDPLLKHQWHFHERGNLSPTSAPGGTNIAEVWNHVPGSHDIVVAVLDTGYLFDHPDTSKQNVLPGYDFVSDASKENDLDPGRDPDATDPGDACAPWNTDSWHGSHVAGTIGSVGTANGLGVAGVSPIVSIMPVRVLGKCGGTTIDMVEGLLWSADLLSEQELQDLDLPRVPQKANIANLSLGGPGVCIPALQDIFQRVVESGTMVIVAAGNDSDDASNYFPASCIDAVTVSANDINGNLASRYSNFGDVVDIMAPGGDIKTDFNSDGYADGVLSISGSNYSFYNGTSMAAPHVAGVAALILAIDPSLTPQEVEAYLTSFSVPRDSTHCPAPCGKGMLSAEFLIPN